MNNLEKNKLAINQEGMLVETGKKEISVNSIIGLQEVNYEPAKFQVVVQMLPEKDVQTESGLILPASKKELKAVIVVASKETEYKRGQVVKLDGNMFIKRDPMTGSPAVEIPVDYIDDKPCLQIPEHFILGIYTNIDLTNWK